MRRSEENLCSFFFVLNVHNGYELEKVFGIQANLLSKYFDEDVWQEYCDICCVPSADTSEITIKFYDIDVETR